MNVSSKALMILLTLLLLGSAQVAYAEDRSFEISEVNIHAVIEEDGDLIVTETDTYRFDGAFNGILVDLVTSGSDGLELFLAYEVSGEESIPLRTELTNNGSRVQYRVYSASEDETKTFRLEYSFKNVVQVYADTAELYWQFFDNLNENRLGKVHIDVELPNGASKEQIRAFGHGPLNGQWAIGDDSIVRYDVSPLPEYTMMEARVLFPSDLVPGSTKISDAPMLEKILEEEANWGVPPDNSYTWPGFVALLLTNLAIGIYAVRRYGTEPKSTWTGKYYRELPSAATPAVIGYFLNHHSLGPRDLMATLLDLVRRKYVTMQEMKNTERFTKSDYMFQLTQKDQKELQKHEKLLLNLLFTKIRKKNTIMLSDIREFGKNHPQSFLNSWKKWQEAVTTTYDGLEYTYERQKKVYRYILLAFAVEFIYFLFLAPEDWKWLVLCSPVLPFFKPKRILKTAAGATEHAKWMAFKRFLRNYTRIASREPMAVHLWEQYLVYAIPLGVAKKVAKIARQQLPNTDPGTLSDHHYYVDYYTWTAAFQQTLSEANQAVNPSSSSSSSDSGSFSSGGGGGGGGGGRGAF